MSVGLAAMPVLVKASSPIAGALSLGVASTILSVGYYSVSRVVPEVVEIAVDSMEVVAVEVAGVQLV